MPSRADRHRVFAALLCGLAFATGVTSQVPGSISGEIHDARGDPVAAARLEVRSRRDGGVLVRGLTDAAGFFAMHGLPTDGRELEVRAVARGHTIATASVLVSERLSTQGLPMRMWDAVELAVRVVDDGGDGVVGAHVRARYTAAAKEIYTGAAKDLEFPHDEAMTGEGGIARLHHAPVGPVVLSVWAPGLGYSSEELWLRDEGERVLQVARQPNTRLQVRIDGLPEATEADIHVMPARATRAVDALSLPYALSRGRTARSIWSIESPPTMRLLLRASSPGWWFIPEVTFWSAASGPKEVVFKAMAIPETTVRGVVLDSMQRPLPDEVVICGWAPQIEEFTATTDSLGRFEVRSTVIRGQTQHLRLANPKLVVSSRNTTSEEPIPVAQRGRYTFAVNPSEVVQVLAANAAVVRGLLLDQGDAPGANRRVELQAMSGPLGEAPWRTMAEAYTSRTGEFEFGPLDPPATELRVCLDGRETISSPSFRLRAGQDLQDVLLRAPTLLDLRGSVLDVDGAPVPGALVVLRSFEVETRRLVGPAHSAVTDRRGRYCLPTLEPGQYVSLTGFEGSDEAQADMTSKLELRGDHVHDIRQRR